MDGPMLRPGVVARWRSTACPGTVDLPISERRAIGSRARPGGPEILRSPLLTLVITHHRQHAFLGNQRLEPLTSPQRIGSHDRILVAIAHHESGAWPSFISASILSPSDVK